MATSGCFRIAFTLLLGCGFAWAQGSAWAPDPGLFRVPGGPGALAAPRVVVDPGLFRLQVAEVTGPAGQTLNLTPHRRRLVAANTSLPTRRAPVRPWAQDLVSELLVLGWPAIGHVPKK